MTDQASDAPAHEPQGDTPLSSDEAVLALTETQQEIQPDAPSGEPVEPEAATDGEQNTVDPDLPAIEAPRSWGAEAKAHFEALPRETQEIILARETDRDRATSKAVSEASQARKQAEQEAQSVAQFRAQLDELLPKALQTFAGRWEGIDWARLAQENPTQYVQAKAAHDAEQAELGKLQAAQEQAQQVDHQNHVRTVAARLAEIEPELTDPKEGNSRIQALAQHLSSRGITLDTLKWASAEELSIAYDAMRWRNLQAQASAAKTKQPAPAPVPARPAGGAQRSSQTTEVQSAQGRFNAKPTSQNAIDLIVAKGL